MLARHGEASGIATACSSSHARTSEAHDHKQVVGSVIGQFWLDCLLMENLIAISRDAHD